jgi:hypothetical protein
MSGLVACSRTNGPISTRPLTSSGCSAARSHFPSGDIAEDDDVEEPADLAPVDAVAVGQPGLASDRAFFQRDFYSAPGLGEGLDNPSGHDCPYVCLDDVGIGFSAIKLPPAPSMPSLETQFLDHLKSGHPETRRVGDGVRR